MVVGECQAGIRGIREFKEFRWGIIPQKTSMRYGLVTDWGVGWLDGRVHRSMGWEYCRGLQVSKGILNLRCLRIFSLCNDFRR